MIYVRFAPESGHRSRFLITAFSISIFFEIAEITSQASGRWREDRGPPHPEVDLSKTPTPIVDPGRVVALLSMLSLADWMSATGGAGQG